MNFYVIRKIIGKIMVLMGLLMFLPLIVCFIYQEELINYLSFALPSVLLIFFGLVLSLGKKQSMKMQAREGFVIVGLSWLLMALFGCLPFILSRRIPNFFDAFFEMASGFTTTGSSILTKDVLENLPHSILFWRSFSHWIGGMGVLVFILAFIPESKEGSSMHILRAESPGPQVGKLTSKMSVTSRILYIIYIVLTLMQILILWIGPDKRMGLFDSIIITFGTAGTGGFSSSSEGIAIYSAYSQYVIAIFMIIFGINFSMFYFLLIKNYKDIIRNEELRCYLLVILVSVVIVFISVRTRYATFEETFRVSLFQVASIISTTGFSTVGYETWPSVALSVLLLLTIFGASAGSTAGGMKISRIVILLKSIVMKIKSTINPRKVETIHVDGKKLDNDTISFVHYYILLYFIILITCAFLISFDNFDIVSNLTASLTCISNVGPGLSVVGPSGNFSGFSNFSKFILSLEMISGRLELFPVIILFYPKTWLSR